MNEFTLPDLYKLDSKDKIRVRKSKVINQDGVVKWIIETGILDGNLVTNETIYTEGKGGKTAHEQAVAEAVSAHKLKIKKNKYVEDMKAIYSEPELPVPMTAITYDDIKFEPPYWVQPKIDGERCMIRVTENEITKWTRSGNILLNINHMDEELKLARMSITKDSEVIFDGELFIPNVAFKDLNGVLKSKPVDIDTLSGKAKDKAEKHERLLGKVQFNIFDIVTDEPFSQRISHLKIAFIGSKYKYLKEVDTRYVLTQEESDAAHKLFNNTYEGSMIRKPDGKYEHKRSKSLVKRKEFIDEEFEIVDVVPAEREPDLGLYVCQTTDGTRFNVTPKCTKKEKREILKNKDNFVGKKLTVKYQEKFENGIPRFGVGLRVREDV